MLADKNRRLIVCSLQEPKRGLQRALHFYLLFHVIQAYIQQSTVLYFWDSFDNKIFCFLFLHPHFEITQEHNIFWKSAEFVLQSDQEN